jgi:peptide/nickel transport system permease protein
MAKKVTGERTRGRELAKDNAALAKAYNVSKSTARDTFVSIFMSIVHNRRALIGMIILILYVLLAIFGPMFADKSLLKSNIRERLEGPSWKHPLGTDNNGRDTLTQFVLGARNVLTVAFIAAIMTLIIASVIGMVSGLCGGWIDSILMFITNIIMTVPSMPIMMLLATVMTAEDPFTFGFVLSIWSWAGLARSIRAQVMSVKNRDYIEAAKILGMPTRHIIVNEMMPSLTSYLTMNLIFSMRGAITASVSLMFLGVAKFSASHWGMMIQIALSSTGALFGSSALIYFLTPVMGIVIFGIGCFFFASGLDEALNPRLRTQ